MKGNNMEEVIKVGFRYFLFLSLSIIISSCSMTNGAKKADSGPYRVSPTASAASGGGKNANAIVTFPW